MHGKKDQESLRKGPWKAEEDEVLLNHVNKYGPRDWSSIRSKGLLQRTGKSCRLRWVNKLRPNLKNGCKFTLEEERVVLELQAQIGNKWAKIASYLPGRTDNDVKNFWSSRQKRLARILQTTATSSKPHKNKNQVPTLHKTPKFSSSSEGESSSKVQSCSLSCIENSEFIKMVPLPDLINSKLLNSDTILFKQEVASIESNSSTDTSAQIIFPEAFLPQTDFTFSVESQDILARIDERNFIDAFGPMDAPDLGIGAQLPFGFPLFDPSGSCRIGRRDTIYNLSNLDSFFNDFPEDLFDHMEPPPNPPEQ